MRIFFVIAFFLRNNSHFLNFIKISNFFPFHENSQLISSITKNKLFLPLFYIFNFQLITHPYQRLIATHEANKDCEKVHLTRAQKILKEILNRDYMESIYVFHFITFMGYTSTMHSLYKTDILCLIFPIYIKGKRERERDGDGGK